MLLILFAEFYHLGGSAVKGRLQVEPVPSELVKQTVLPS